MSHRFVVLNKACIFRHIYIYTTNSVAVTVKVKRAISC